MEQGARCIVPKTSRERGADGAPWLSCIPAFDEKLSSKNSEFSLHKVLVKSKRRGHPWRALTSTTRPGETELPQSAETERLDGTALGYLQDPDGDIGPPEALTADQKSDLVAFLKRL